MLDQAIQIGRIIEPSKMEEFISYSNEMQTLEEEQEKWFQREEKLKEYRFSFQKDVYNVFETEIQKLKAEHDKKNEEGQKELQDLENLIQEIKRESIKNNDEMLAEKINEKEQLETKLEEQRLDRMKNILLLEKESYLYLQAIKYKNKHHRCIEALKELNEHFDEIYENVEYQQLKKEIEDPIQYVICPRCLGLIHEIIPKCCISNIVRCFHCGYQFCTLCDHSYEDHHFPEQYRYCTFQYDIKFINDPNATKNKSFYICPIDYEKRKQISIWKKYFDKYIINKEKYETLEYDFLIKKDENSHNGNNHVKLSKLCIRTRLARMILRDVEDRNEVKEKTMKILNTVLEAQSIVTLSYPTIFFFAEDSTKVDSLTLKINVIENEIDTLTQILYHPEQSSIQLIEQKIEYLQNLNDSFVESN